jgi:hypothetical protein
MISINKWQRHQVPAPICSPIIPAIREEVALPIQEHLIMVLLE